MPLLLEFLRFIEAYHPDYVFVENVPGLQKCRNTAGPFDTLLEKLTQLEYHYHTDILASQDYGVPQYRRRLVLLASRLGPVDFPAKTHGPGRTEGYATVRQWIHDLPALAAGESHPKVANHRAALLSPRNLERIRATPPGGGRLDWPEHLWLGCHAKHSGHTDVYGRMHWDQPATGLTTRCISLSNGRFGHPEQNRAISVREAACIQTFPRDFVFYGNLASMARQIGNAVPVLLARRFGQTIQQHYRQYNKPYGPI